MADSHHGDPLDRLVFDRRAEKNRGSQRAFHQAGQADRYRRNLPLVEEFVI